MGMELELLTDNHQRSRRLKRDRRVKPSLLHFNLKSLNGRRAHPRRVMERHYYRGRVGYFTDVYQREIGLLGVLLVVLSCVDAFMTLRVLQLGAIEINPLMDGLIKGDIESFVGLKVALTIFSVLLFVRYSNFRLVGGIKVINIMRVTCVGYGALVIYELALFQYLISI